MSAVVHSKRRDGFVHGLLNHRDPRVPFMALSCALSIGALVYVAQFAVTAYDSVYGGIDTQTDPAPVVLSVGPDPLHIPGNMIRHPRSARGSVSELELRMHWPTMDGLSERRAASFRTSDTRSQIIYATLRTAGPLPPQERIRRIYPRILDYPPTSGPAGLIAARFVDGHGYDGETLYTSAEASEPFAARCTPDDTGVPSTCIVEFRAGNGMDVTYRFHRHLLSRWRSVDAAMRATVASFQREGAD